MSSHVDTDILIDVTGQALTSILISPGPSKKGSHRTSVAAKCIREHGFHLEEKAAGGVNRLDNHPPIVTGTLLHLALAHHYAIETIKKYGVVTVDNVKYTDASVFLSPSDAVLALAAKKNERVWEDAANVVIETLPSYKLWAIGHDANLQVLAVEQQLKLDMTSYYERVWAMTVKMKMEIDKSFWDAMFADPIYTQRADLIVRLRSSKQIMFVDHKKTFLINNRTSSQHVLGRQFLGYQAIGAKLIGAPFAGVLLNRIKPIGQSGQKPEFDRAVVQRAPKAVEVVLMDIAKHEFWMKFWEQSGQPADEWPGALHEEICVSKYGECPYLERCSWGK